MYIFERCSLIFCGNVRKLYTTLHLLPKDATTRAEEAESSLARSGRRVVEGLEQRSKFNDKKSVNKGNKNTNKWQSEL